MKNKIEEKRIDELTPDIHNANLGTERGLRALDDSLTSVGLGRSVVTDKHGRIIAGNKTVERATDRGFEDAIVVHTDGKQLVVVQRDDLDLAEGGKARELAYYDNRVAELDLTWNPEQLQADKEAGVQVVDKLWHPVELEEILQTPSFVDKDAKPNPRNLPIDVIFTISSAPRCCVAVDAGWLYGIQSNQMTANGAGLCLYHGKKHGHELVFVDNDYFNYDHNVHLDTVKNFSPKYATVMDVMTPEQCKKDNIKHHPFDQILDWAEELSKYAENVIVIPKYDCLDRIPEQYILGYSVPTSHGGTPLPPERFRGRRVHLLGGSWTKQLAHLAVLGDDVVSLDNNHENIRCEYGTFTDPNGIYNRLEHLLTFQPTNGLMCSLAIGLGAIATKINELYPKAVEVPAINQNIGVPK